MTITQAEQSTSTTKAKRKQQVRDKATVDKQQHHKHQATLVVPESYRDLSDPKFPLYKPFTLSPESTELFIKADKNTIVSLDTQEKYRASGMAHMVKLIVEV